MVPASGRRSPRCSSRSSSSWGLGACAVAAHLRRAELPAGDAARGAGHVARLGLQGVRPATAEPDGGARGPASASLRAGVGFVVTGVGVVLGFTVSLPAVPIAAAVAIVAAVLNAAFGLCLGCEMYLLIRRFAPVVRTSGASGSRSL
ncbi:DUF4395 family protein [Oerskovia sp. M15]